MIELTYKAPLKQIDAHMAAHVAFLKKYYAAGKFLVSGRQIPRVGGIILAAGSSREQIAATMAEDPFCREGLADVRIVEFRASQRAPAIPKELIASLTMIVSRHESLRTRFVDQDGIACQVIEEAAVFRVSEEALAGDADLAFWLDAP